MTKNMTRIAIVNWIESHIARILLAIWLAFHVGYATTKAGQPSDCEPFPLIMPIIAFFFFGATALLGWCAGREARG